MLPEVFIQVWNNSNEIRRSEARYSVQAAKGTTCKKKASAQSSESLLKQSQYNIPETKDKEQNKNEETVVRIL